MSRITNSHPVNHLIMYNLVQNNIAEQEGDGGKAGEYRRLRDLNKQ